MMVDHRLLYGVQSAGGLLQALDRDELLAVQGRQKADTRIDRTIRDTSTRQFAEHDGAGAAISLGAALLGTASALNLAQVVENGHGRRWLIDAHDAAVQNEPQSLCGAGVCTGGERHRGQLPRYVE